MTTATMDQWSSVKTLLGSLPQWIADEQERKRIAAYAVYEAIYWCNPEAFKAFSRGQEDNPIYVPSGRSIVETTNRYLANEMQIVPDPTKGTPNDQELALQVINDLCARERFYSRFNSNKRFGLIRGDWFFHFYADPLREAGSRISIMGVDPASVFPIYNPLNIDEIIGYHIAEQYLDDKGDLRIKRLTYRKVTEKGGPSPITREEAIFEIDKWGGPGMDPEDVSVVQVTLPLATLPSPIDQLPVYHVQNFQEPGTIFGSSEMRGVERLMAGINQGISDEELSLALEGLGVYATDSGSPTNAEGQEVPWNLGPARVVEHETGTKFVRVNGVGSVTPSQDHLAYLHAVLDDVFGISAVAKGKADVNVAESGIAMMIELAPLLAHVTEKEQIVTDVLGNMMFDLAKWYVAYEGTVFNSLMEVTRWIPVYGNKIPPNREKQVAELLELAKSKPPVVSNAYIRMKLRELGYEDMPDDATMMTQIALEQTSAAMAEQDAFGSRVDGEIAAQGAAGDTGSEEELAPLQ